VHHRSSPVSQPRCRRNRADCAGGEASCVLAPRMAHGKGRATGARPHGWTAGPGSVCDEARNYAGIGDCLRHAQSSGVFAATPDSGISRGRCAGAKTRTARAAVCALSSCRCRAFAGTPTRIWMLSNDVAARRAGPRLRALTARSARGGRARRLGPPERFADKLTQSSARIAKRRLGRRFAGSGRKLNAHDSRSR